MRKEEEIDIYQFDVKTDGGSEIQVDSRTKDLAKIKEELKNQGIYFKSIKYKRKVKRLIWV